MEASIRQLLGTWGSRLSLEFREEEKRNHENTKHQTSIHETRLHRDFHWIRKQLYTKKDPFFSAEASFLQNALSSFFYHTHQRGPCRGERKIIKIKSLLAFCNRWPIHCQARSIHWGFEKGEYFIKSEFVVIK